MFSTYIRFDVKNYSDDHVKYKLGLIRPLIVEGHSFVAGGVFKSIFAEGTEFNPKDIDVFFHTDADHTKMLNQFSRLSQGENPRFRYEYANANTVAYKNTETDVIVELIMKDFGTPDHILDGFDFTCVKCAAVVENGEYRLVMHPQFAEDLVTKTLRFHSRKPFDADGVFNRIVRYSSYGFNVSTELKSMLFDNIKQYSGPISDPKVKKY